MQWTFVPEQKDSTIAAPWFEDARADFAPYYSTSTTVKAAQAQVTAEMGKLGAAIINFQSGKSLCRSASDTAMSLNFYSAVPPDGFRLLDCRCIPIR